MAMRINGDMLILAREFREITQKELSKKVIVAQSTIAKIESGIHNEVSDELAHRLADAVGFSSDFLCQTEELMSYGSSAYFYRKRATMPSNDRRRIHSIVNLYRIAVRRFVNLVDIEPRRPLPQLEVEEYTQSAAKVAKALRGMWNLPDGPIRDLTGLVESAGVVVIPCDFGTRLFDATSLRLSDMPPLIFINANVPGDRWRYTLAHELGHLVMHSVPHEWMEKEADEFAAEFLTPAEEIVPQLMQIKTWRIRELAKLKLFWRVSFQMLVMRASKLKIISQDEARKAFIAMAPDRLIEPLPIEREATNSFSRVVTAITNDLKLEISGLMALTKWPDDVTKRLLPFSVGPAPKLRLIQS